MRTALPSTFFNLALVRYLVVQPVIHGTGMRRVYVSFHTHSDRFQIVSLRKGSREYRQMAGWLAGNAFLQRAATPPRRQREYARKAGAKPQIIETFPRFRSKPKEVERKLPL